MTTTTTTATYTLKNIKTFTGREGGGFEASLYRDGKKIGIAYNDANGGCNGYHIDPAIVSHNTVMAELTALGRTVSDGEWELADAYIDHLLMITELARLSKKSVVYKQRPDDADMVAKYGVDFNNNEYAYKLRATTTDDLARERVLVVGFIKTKYPTSLVWDANVQAWV